MKRFLLAGLCLAAAPSIARAETLDTTRYGAPAWSPFVVGAGIGVLSWLTFVFSGKAIGASSFYATLAGLVAKAVAPRRTASLKYFRDNPPKLDWAVVFVGCVILGALVSAWTGGEFTNQWVPPMWTARFGDNALLRGGMGFLGGVCMAFGARLAGGCTSGHGISGTLQLNVGSWITVICMFAAGVAAAFLLYRF